MPKSSASFGGPKANPRGYGGRPKVVGHIRDLCRNLTPEALEIVVKLMKSDKTPAAARLAAAQEIINRGYGKPPATYAGEDGEGVAELVLTINRPERVTREQWLQAREKELDALVPPARPPVQRH